METENKEETANEQRAAHCETLADLPVSDEQSQHTTGGSISFSFTKIEYKYVLANEH